MPRHSKLRNSDDDLDRGSQPSGSDDTETADDAEGHMFLPHDPATARQLARNRSAELERDARDRARSKEARPNRRSS